MKKSIGNESQKLAREARRASRATLPASGGIGVPCSTLALVQAINLFWHRQIMPQTFRNMIVPSPQPTLIERLRLLTSRWARRERTSQDVAETQKPRRTVM